MGRGTHSRRRLYLPKQNHIVSTCTGDGGIGNYIWSYVKDEVEITKEMWESMTTANENYIIMTSKNQEVFLERKSVIFSGNLRNIV